MAKYKLGDICEIVSGSTPKTGIDEYWDGNIKWITPAELNDDTYIVTDSVRKITELAVKKTGLSSFPKGTVILSSRAPIGKVAIAGCEMYCNQGFKNFICSDKINSKYLYWFLKGNTAYLNSLGRGATFKEISKGIVSEIEINVPNIEKQEEAVATLEKTSEIIALRKKELIALDDLIKARFVEMFGDPVSNPMRWKGTILRTVCSKITDGEHGSVPRVEIGHPFLNAKHVLKNGLIDWASVSFTDDEVHEKLCRRCSPEKNDILMTTTGTIGNIAIVPDMESFSMDRGITLLKLDYELVDSVFIACMLRFDGIQALMQSNVHASAIGHLFLNKVEQIPIILPPLDMQRQFSNFVAQVDKSKVVKQKVRIRTINISSTNAVIRI